MRILILADLHLDEIVDRGHLSSLSDAIIEVGAKADMMIIAGDLTEHAAHRWPTALRWLGAKFPSDKTLILPGNHDYYGGRLDTLDEELARICTDAGCQFGQRKRTEIGSLRILTTTLWTDFKLFEGRGEGFVEQSLLDAVMMPDYGHEAIRIAERQIKPEDTALVHQAQKSWLLGELSLPWHGRTMIVTHHAPSASVVGLITPLSPCFASNLEDVIDLHRPAAWIFGHTHCPTEVISDGGTLLKNVSVGYDDELRPGDIIQRVRGGLINIEVP